MPNQWGRQPMGKESWTLVLGVIIIGLVGYLFIPNFLKSINSSTETTLANTSLSNVNSSSTYNSDTQNSYSSSSQLQPSTSGTLNIGSENNAISSGYWVIFVSGGTSKQLSVNDQEFSFLQELIQHDNNGNNSATVYLVENGQIKEYTVSNEVFSIISDIAAINARSSNASSNSSVAPATTLPSTTTPTAQLLP